MLVVIVTATKICLTELLSRIRAQLVSMYNNMYVLYFLSPVSWNNATGGDENKVLSQSYLTKPVYVYVLVYIFGVFHFRYTVSHLGMSALLGKFFPLLTLLRFLLGLV